MTRARADLFPISLVIVSRPGFGIVEAAQETLIKASFLLTALLLVAACTAIPTPASMRASSPHAAIKAMYSALNSGDLEGAMKYFAADAIFIVRRRPFNLMLAGQDQIRAWLARDVQNHVLSEFSDLSGSANNLTVLYKRIDHAEVISQEEQTFVVLNGKIRAVGVDPESVIRYAFRALNDQNVELALRFFSDNASCSLESGTVSVGKAALRNAMQKLVDARDVFETDVQLVEGYYEVTWELKVYDRTGHVISDSHKTSFLKDGQIVICEREE